MDGRDFDFQGVVVKLVAWDFKEIRHPLRFLYYQKLGEGAALWVEFGEELSQILFPILAFESDEHSLY